MTFNMLGTFIAIGVLGLSLGLPMLELNEPEGDAPLQPLPISMSLAVRAAEAVAPGQAIHAQLELAQGRPVYEIDMLSLDHSLNKVQVDAEDGQVAVVIREEDEQMEKQETVQPQQGGAI
jgi:uncharacterized membrane protein YkoI